MNELTNTLIIAGAILVVILLAITLVIVNGLEENHSKLHRDSFNQANFDYRVAVTLFGRNKKFFMTERDSRNNTLRSITFNCPQGSIFGLSKITSGNLLTANGTSIWHQAMDCAETVSLMYHFKYMSDTIGNSTIKYINQGAKVSYFGFNIFYMQMKLLTHIFISNNQLINQRRA